MKAVIQAILDGECRVEDRITGSIKDGLVVFFCVEKGDTDALLKPFLDKILKLRLYRDDNGRANFSIMDRTKEILFVSQFTLAANIRKGNRPSFDNSEDPIIAEKLYEKAIDYLRSQGALVEVGEFGSHMRISYINDGPQTFIWETKNEK